MTTGDVEHGPVRLPKRINESFLRQVVGVIERNTERWNQSGYRLTGECGDTFCLAGWALHTAGYDVYGFGRRDRGPRAIFWKAAELLGLNRRQATALFFWADEYRCHPTVTDLKARITEVTGVAFPDNPGAHVGPKGLTCP